MEEKHDSLLQTLKYW